MSTNEKFLDTGLDSINIVHDDAIIEEFRRAVGKKVFLLMPSFPFVFIGKIVDIDDDLLILDVETTQFPQLEKKKWFIHVHQIEVFYIETPHGPKIPELKD